MNEPGKPAYDGEHWWWTQLFPVLVVLALTMVISTGIYDVGGRDDNEHPFPMPSNVQRLTDKMYLVPRNAVHMEDTLCWGNGGVDTERVEDIRPLANTAYKFIRCGEAQWFDPRFPKKPSMNFANGMSRTFKSPLYWALAFLGFMWLLPWPKIIYWRRLHEYNRKHAEVTKDLEEQRLREVVRAYANHDITEQEYDAGMERAYMAGVTKAGLDD